MKSAFLMISGEIKVNSPEVVYCLKRNLATISKSNKKMNDYVQKIFFKSLWNFPLTLSSKSSYRIKTKLKLIDLY